MIRPLRLTVLFIGTLALAGLFSSAQAPAAAKTYHSPDDVAAAIKSYAAKFPELAKAVTIGRSAGGRDIHVLRVASSLRGGNPETRPAILVAANLEGLYPPGTEAALAVAEQLLTRHGTDKKIAGLLEQKTVWVAPLVNPDAAAAFFGAVRAERSTNGRPVDDDVDGRQDEDGGDDLNKDGLITQMRFKDPEGQWIADPKEPRLMRLADAKKGEKGVYKVLGEGLDNDGDGEFNEDPGGGVDVARNFPHDFEYGVKAAGGWPASEPETAALLEFMTSHPSIGLVLVFSTENTILNQQQTGQARVGGDRVKVPRQYAAYFGLDPDTEYTLKEIVDALKALNIGGGMEIDEGMVAMFLGLGPAVAIDRQDQPLFEAVQKEYKDGLKEAKIEDLDKRAKGVGKGSFAAYAYYHFGVPVFSMDLWAVPEPKKEQVAQEALSPDKLKTMSSDEFLALGEEKIASFLQAQGAPPNFNAAMLMGMVKSGQVTPARMAEMMEKMPKKPGAEGEDHPDTYLVKWSDTALQGKGFVAWTPVKHPQLGEVEVGGFVPYFKTVPARAELDPTLNFHAGFALGLMARLPELAVKATKVEALGGDLFRVTVHIANNGWFPTAMGQGRRALTAWPVRVKLKLAGGQKGFSGRPIA
ncbi:MAG: M14 family metallopeptidase, partial [Candidatus Aminicenantes bacterium]|nr:M14 family metallopeptidase [Candidatus Aminicenantes bacterium]